MKIAIGLPTNRLIKPKTADSLLKLVAVSKYDFEMIVSTRGYTTAENRNYIAAQAVKRNCTHLFMVDDDMIYEVDTLEKLIAHDKDIVGGVAFTKYEVQVDVNEYIGEKKEGELRECSAMGGGVLLVKCDVFKKVSQPHFGYIWNDNGSVRESNDWYFCHKAQKHGYKLWCDSSITAKHIGKYEY